MRFIRKYKILFIYGLSLALLVLLLKIIEYRLVIADHSFEIYIGSIALLFTLLGIWLSNKLTGRKKEVQIIEREKIIEKAVFIPAGPFVADQQALDATELSARELEVLQLMANGLSNQEIAASLYVSVNTIKTHATNLFAKLGVTRRTQAVDKAKKLLIIP